MRNEHDNPAGAISSIDDLLKAPGACNSIGCKRAVPPMNGSVGRTRWLCWSERPRNYGDVIATMLLRQAAQE